MVARYWVARSMSSPSLAARVQFAAQLRWVIDTSDRHGDTQLASRAAAELAIALGWSGQLDEAISFVKLARELEPDPHPWAIATADSLDAMGQGIRGNFVGAGNELVRLAAEFERIGEFEGSGLANLFLAASFFRIAGDADALDDLFVLAERYERQRFGRYSWSALLFERARVAVERNNVAAGVMLRRAFEELTRYGEHRTAAVSRTEGKLV